MIPGDYHARVPIANGYLSAAVASAGPFFEKDFNHTNHHVGPESDVNEGWPLWNNRQTFSTVSGFWDCQPTTPGYNYPELQRLGCESVISGLPHPLALHLIIGDTILNATVDPSTITNFRQTLSFKDGITRWTYTWSPNNTHVAFDIEYTTLASRERMNIAATELRVTPRGGNYNATIVDVLDGRSAVRSFLGSKGLYDFANTIYVSSHPDGLPYVEAFTVSRTNVSNGYTDSSSRRMVTHPAFDGNMTIGQEWDTRLLDGKTAVFQKFVGVASSDKFSNPEFAASMASLVAYQTGFDNILSEHTQSWNKLMGRNFITSYRNPETGKLPENETTLEALQIGATADYYFIMQNLLPEDGQNYNDNGISVGGLTSDTYGGMIFWDQETWVFPAIAVTRPEYARQIIKYRLKLYKQAKSNTQMPYVQDNLHHSFDNNSALYPWTSGRFGNATATGPALNYEYHLNSDIVLSIFQYLRITGDKSFFHQECWPVVESIGHSIASVLFRDGDGWSIENMTDPDEYAVSNFSLPLTYPNQQYCCPHHSFCIATDEYLQNHVDNGAFTLASFGHVLHKIIEYQQTNGLSVNETWIDMANNVNIPRASSGITAEYRGMKNNATVKQADVVLLPHLLGFNEDYPLDVARKDVAYYSQKQTPDGPAMTHAVEAIAESLVAESGTAAYIMDLQAKLPNYRAPWYQMSEQVNDDKNVNGGTSPAFPFLTGHGGALQVNPFGYLGMDLTQDTLTIQPSLPHPFSNLQLQDLHFNGATIRVSMNSTHTNLTRIPSPASRGLFEKYPNRSMPFTVGRPNGRIEQRFYNISINQMITIQNDMYWQKATTPNNILQSQTTNSECTSMPGQYPGAATDGNTGTRWQPMTRELSKLTVNTSSVPFQRVKQINLDWGARPPRRARVGFTNHSNVDSIDSSIVWKVPIPDTSPNQLYSENEALRLEVIPYVGNRTEYVLPDDTPVWTGRYVMLEIEGCYDCGRNNGNDEEDDLGAAVGEFEVIGHLGTNLTAAMDDENADERKGTNEEWHG